MGYLLQGGKSYNFMGIQQTAPFQVDLPAKKACPHAINPNVPMPDRVHWGLFLEVYKDDLSRKFLPIPRHRTEPVPFLPDPNNDKQMLLFLLSKLSSPIYPVVERFEKQTIKFWEAELQTTNVCPLVLTNIQTYHQMDMEELAYVARRAPRRLILVGDPMMVVRDPMERVNTFIDDLPSEKLYSLPMENLGAVALRRHCRGEQINGEWVRKEKA